MTSTIGIPIKLLNEAQVRFFFSSSLLPLRDILPVTSFLTTHRLLVHVAILTSGSRVMLSL